MSVIKNAANTPLNQNTGTLPDMSTTLLNWLQPMVFAVVTKDVENFQVVETMESVSFNGVWQPFTSRQLMLKPEGQRAWNWFTVHALTQLPLDTDQVVNYLGKQYRVMQKLDYEIYGYFEYHIVEDYTGAGPTEAP